MIRTYANKIYIKVDIRISEIKIMDFIFFVLRLLKIFYKINVSFY